MANQLPEDKKSKLKERVADGVAKELDRQRDDLVKHEVGKDDVDEIVEGGLVDGWFKHRGRQ